MKSKTTPWQHQIEAYNAAYRQEGFGLFMDMGTGKTKVAVDIIANRDYKRILIVCPKSVLMDGLWSREIVTHGAFDPIIVPLIKGTAKTKALILENRWQEDCIRPVIYIINYDSVWRRPLSDIILGRNWGCVILDEAHRIKAPGSRVSRFFGRLSCRIRQRLALTGTPMPNSPLDLYGIFRFIDPRVFGTNFGRFKDRYAIMGGYQNYQVVGYKNQAYLMQELEAHSFRVEIDDVIDMPPVIDVYKTGELNSSARGIYNQMDREMITGLPESGKVTVADNILVKLLRLRQLVAGALYTEDGSMSIVSIDKQNLLRETLTDLITTPLVIFCTFIHEEESIRGTLSEMNILFSEMTGARNTFREWKEGKTQVLLVQINAGSEGLSMVRANHAIYYSKPYSLGVYEQSIARLRRPGQEKNTIVLIHLQLTNTIDILIDTALKNKKDVVESILAVYDTTHTKDVVE